MRLVEEKKFMKLQLISLAVVFLSTFMIQIADYHIYKHNNLILQEMLKISNVLQVHIASRLQSEFAFFKYFIPWEKAENEDIIKKNAISSYKDRTYLGPELEELVSKLEKGEISLKQYFVEFSNIQGLISHNRVDIYNERVPQLRDKVKRGTSWSTWKKFLFIPLQMLCLLCLAWGYFSLLRDISKRTSKKL
jgi:hypothetical protein